MNKFYFFSVICLALSNYSFALPNIHDDEIIVDMHGEVLYRSCAVKLAGTNDGSVSLGSSSIKQKGPIVPIVFEFNNCDNNDGNIVTIKLSKNNLRNSNKDKASLNVLESRKAWVSLLKSSVGDVYFNPNKDIIARTNVSSKSVRQVHGLWARLETQGQINRKLNSKGYFTVEFD